MSMLRNSLRRNVRCVVSGLRIAVSAKSKDKAVDKPKRLSQDQNNAKNWVVDVDTQQVEHDKSVADELKKREKLAEA